MPLGGENQGCAASGLNADVLLLILQDVRSPPIFSGFQPADPVIQVYNHSPLDTLTTTLVCRSWHSISQHIIDRLIPLVIDCRLHSQNTRLLGRLQTDGNFRSRVRHICVRNWYCSGQLPLRAYLRVWKLRSPAGRSPDVTVPGRK